MNQADIPGQGSGSSIQSDLIVRLVSNLEKKTKAVNKYLK